MDIPIGYAHGTHHPKPHIDLCKASLAHPYSQDKLESWGFIARHHSLCIIIETLRKLK
jgi:hypothetical protein